MPVTLQKYKIRRGDKQQHLCTFICIITCAHHFTSKLAPFLLELPNMRGSLMPWEEELQMLSNEDDISVSGHPSTMAHNYSWKFVQ